MTDVPWETKKDSKKGPSEDTPPATAFPWEKDKSAEQVQEPPASAGIPDILAGAFDDIPMEEVKEIELKPPEQESESAEQTVPFAAPSFAGVPDLMGSAPEEPQLSTVHTVEVKEPPGISVINGLSGEMQTDKTEDEGIRTVVPTKPDEESPVPSFVEVFGQEEKTGGESVVVEPEGEPDRSKVAPPPLFEPTLPPETGDLGDTITPFPSPSPPPLFEMPGQKVPEPITGAQVMPESAETEPPVVQTTEQMQSVEPVEDQSPQGQVLEQAPPDTPTPFAPPEQTELLVPPPFPVPDAQAPSPLPPATPPPATPPPATPPPATPVTPPESHTAKVKTASPAAGTAKRTVDGIAVLFKNLLKNLTRSGSLIDRVEEMREEVDTAGEELLEEEKAVRAPPAPSPFETVPEKVTGKAELHEMESVPFTAPPIPEVPVEMGILAEEKQEEIKPEREAGISPEEVRLLVEERIDDALSKRLEPATAEAPVEPGGIDELKDEITGSKARMDEITDNVEALSNAVTTAHESIQSIKIQSDEVDSKTVLELDSTGKKIGMIENRLGNLEDTLSVLESSNADLKSGLSGIEQNVSELVDSYSALLSQLHESAASTDSKLIELSGKVDRIDMVESTVSSLEQSQAATGETVAELGNAVSTLMNNVAEMYTANETLKDESETEQVALHTEMESLTKYVEKGLKKVGSGSYGSFGQNVQLTFIEKNSSTMKLCMEWLEFLMELVGRNNLPEILSYYEELEWISDEVRLELLRYAEGIDYYLEKPDWKLNPDDHVKSIWFIERLAGVKVDKNRLSVLERDIKKVKKGTEIYGI